MSELTAKTKLGRAALHCSALHCRHQACWQQALGWPQQQHEDGRLCRSLFCELPRPVVQQLRMLCVCCCRRWFNYRMAGVRGRELTMHLCNAGRGAQQDTVVVL